MTVLLTDLTDRIRRSSPDNRCWFAILFLIILIYLFLVARFTANAPIGDDIALLWHLIEYKTGHYAKAFWDQHNEHRLVLLTGLSVLYHEIFGPLDFRYIALCGNLFLIGAYFLVVEGISRPDTNNRGTDWTVCIIGALLFFSMRFWDESIWPMASLSGFPALFFGLLAAFFIARNKTIFGFIAALLSLLSQGNGLFAFIACALVLWQRKKYRELILWVAASALVVGLYFYNYIPPEHHGSLQGVLADPVGFVRFFLTLWGNTLPWWDGVDIWMITASGAVLFSMIGYTLVRYRNHPSPLGGYLLFCILSVLAVAIGRMNFGIEYSVLATRYTLIPIAAMTTTVVFYLHKYQNTRIFSVKKPFLPVMIIFIIYLMAQYIAYPKYKNQYMQAKNMKRCADGCVSGVLYPPGSDALIQNTLYQAEKLNLYKPGRSSESCFACDNLTILHVLKEPENSPGLIAQINGYLEWVEIENEKEVVVRGWGVGNSDEFIGLDLFMSSSVSPLKNQTRLVRRDDVSANLTEGYVATGFISRLYFADTDDARRAAASLCVATRIRDDYFLLGGLDARCYAKYFKKGSGT